MTACIHEHQAVLEPSITSTVAKPAALDQQDDVALGKEHFAKTNYGLAELHFRRAVEASPTNGEAWLGLAAAYDQLRRFKLADRAYSQAAALMGETPELLNNRGFSYLLRGDLRKASQNFSAAHALDPEDARILQNMRALEDKARGKV